MNIDDVFAEDDDGELHTPDFDPASLEIFNEDDDANDDEVVQLATSDNDSAPSTVQTGKPGTVVKCETCDKEVRVRKDGNLSLHKCEPKPQRGNRLDTLPDRRSPMRPRTRQFAVGIIGWAVEEGTARPLARVYGVDAGDVPTDLPDADTMVGVPLDIVWPELPDSVRTAIDKLADNADVIECGILWAEWVRQVSKWTGQQRRMHKEMAAVQSSRGDGVVYPMAPFVADEAQ